MLRRAGQARPAWGAYLQWLAALAGLQKAPQVWKLKSPFRPDLHDTLEVGAGGAESVLAAPAWGAPAPEPFLFFLGFATTGRCSVDAVDDGRGAAVCATGATVAAATLTFAQKAQALHLQNCTQGTGRSATAAGQRGPAGAAVWTRRGASARTHGTWLLVVHAVHQHSIRVVKVFIVVLGVVHRLVRIPPSIAHVSPHVRLIFPFVHISEPVELGL